MKKIVLLVFLFFSATVQVQADEVDDLIDDIIDAELTVTYCMLTNKELVSDKVLTSASVFSRYLQESKDWRWGLDPNHYVGRAAVLWVTDSSSNMPLSKRCKNILRYGVHAQARSIEEKVKELKKNGEL